MADPFFTQTKTSLLNLLLRTSSILQGIHITRMKFKNLESMVIIIDGSVDREEKLDALDERTHLKRLHGFRMQSGALHVLLDGSDGETEGTPESLSATNHSQHNHHDESEVSIRLNVRRRASRYRPSVEEYSPTHLFVMMHGFQGSSQDLRLFGSTLLIAFPDAQVLYAKSNDDHNEDSIRAMSTRLADEVISFCRGKFFTHSMIVSE